MLKKILIPLKYIWNHPISKTNKLAGIGRFIQWQLASTIKSGSHQVSWIGNLKLNIHKGMHGATGCIYVGLPEFNDMSFLLHYLNADSNFIDIGANVGVYSLLAAGVKDCDTICIEPIPQTFTYLKNNIALNNLTNKITALNIGLSNEKGTLFFTKSEDTMNHVTIDKTDDSIAVKVDVLDEITTNINLKNTLIKLDVEGFEYNVLLGAKKLLLNENVKAFIVELNGCSLKFGLNDKMVDNLLMVNGFEKYDYNPFNRSLTKLNHFYTEENTLYLRKSCLSEIESQLKNAVPYTIFNKSI